MNTVRVTLVAAWPDRSITCELELPQGSTVRDAVGAAGLLGMSEYISIKNSILGVFSKVVSDDWPVHEGDRVEIYRPLYADAKEARLRRQQAARDRRRT